MERRHDDVLVRIAGARKSYATPEGDRVMPLDGIDLDIRANEFLTLLGPSGCGKTTLLKAIAGFEDLDEGEISLRGKPIGTVPPHRRPFNTVFQNYALFPHMTVARNVAYGLEVAGVPVAETRARTGQALHLVGLGEMGQRRPAQLSGGQQQRVALARAIVNRPQMLLLDEPLSALDRALRQQMQVELKTIQHTLGITFLFVTHDQEEAMSMSDRIAVMERGRILQLGTPTAIYDHPANRFVAGFVGAGNIFAGRVEADGTAVRTVGGSIVRLAAPRPAGEAVDVMIRPEHLSPDPAAGESAAFDVTAEGAALVGADLHLRARSAAGEPLLALVRRSRGVDAPPTAGTVWRFHYDPRNVHVMATSGG